jgi:glycosyltransferase involved in cell wall biosynthesis
VETLGPIHCLEARALAEAQIQVSVIVPVYNHAGFVKRAVESALAQPETGEVILIEDGSTDESLSVCEDLASRKDKVRLLRHADGMNHGAGPTRNVGIVNALFDYIAFLDADDFYMENRFQGPLDTLVNAPDIDGVYECVGTHFESEQDCERYCRLRNMTPPALTTFYRRVCPEALFEEILGGGGWFHPDGLLVRRSLFARTGLFDSHLRLAQDSAMHLKMAAVGRLAPGRLDVPVAMRRVHGKNRILTALESGHEYDKYQIMLWDTMLRWFIVHRQPNRRVRLLLHPLVSSRVGRQFPSLSRGRQRLAMMAALSRTLIQHPTLLTRTWFWGSLLDRIRGSRRSPRRFGT